jgi:hypothetical protein
VLRYPWEARRGNVALVVLLLCKSEGERVCQPRRRKLLVLINCPRQAPLISSYTRRPKCAP